MRDPQVDCQKNKTTVLLTSQQHLDGNRRCINKVKLNDMNVFFFFFCIVQITENMQKPGNPFTERLLERLPPPSAAAAAAAGSC